MSWDWLVFIAALQSVFPQSEIGTFLALQKKDKERQLQELAMIVTGIRLFNKDCGKGGEGIDDCKLLQIILITMYRVGQKNVPLFFCPYHHQLLIDFHNSFTGALCRQFAITWLLHIPLHHKCVLTIPCEISMKYAYITIVTNKHFGKIEKLQTNIAVNGLYDTKLCGSNTVKCHTDHSLQWWSEVFFHLPKFFLLSLVFAYIYILQGSVETHLSCNRIYNNLIVANCLQSVPMKKF